jgi:hypothetical protein
MRGCTFPPQRKYLHSFDILRSVKRQFLMDVSGQPIGAIINGQAVLTP